MKFSTWTVRVLEGKGEREMIKGFKKEYGVTEVRNPIGNHIPMSKDGHETKIRIQRKRRGRLKVREKGPGGN